MAKGIINRLDNQEDFMYFQIKSDVSVVYILDEITASLDEYEEGLAYPNKDVVYGKFVTTRTSFNTGGGTIYAIAIYNKDLIDLILFKGNAKFDKFIELMKNNFIYSDGSSL
jgi:hypothetical protein